MFAWQGDGRHLPPASALPESRVMRVVLIASAPPAALGMAQALTGLGHEIPAVLAYRGPEGRYGPGYPFALHGAAPDGDLLFVRSGQRVGALLRAYAPDVALCASFPAWIPDDALDAPRYGIVNMHPSLLPRYRGPNPLGWAIRNDDGEVGMTLHRMTSEFDAGPIYAQDALPVADDDDPATDGMEKFGELATRLISEAFARIQAGEPGQPQDEAQASHAAPFEPAYVEVDWQRTAREIHNQTRAWKMSPPVGGLRGPLTTLDGGRVRLLRTRLDDERGGVRMECGDGPLWVLESERVPEGV
jgi:methionyl-tRNA formyltransferase